MASSGDCAANPPSKTTARNAPRGQLQAQASRAPTFMHARLTRRHRRGAGAIARVDSKIAGAEFIVQEVFLDVPHPISAAYYKIVESERVIPAHDVQQDGNAANLDHRLGFDARLFRNPRTQPAREDEHGNDLLGKRWLQASTPNVCVGGIDKTEGESFSSSHVEFV